MRVTFSQLAGSQRAFVQRLARFRQARSGNVAIMFALVLLPLIGTVGGAIDYGIALSNKSSLQDAIDAASLAGAQAANAYVAANGTGSTQVQQAQVVGNVAAQNVFNADIRVIGNEATPQLNIATTVTNSSPTTVMTAQGNYVPFLLRIIGINVIPISVTATSTMAPTNSFYQIIFVVDVSNSMTVGGTPATISQMIGTKGLWQWKSATTHNTCAFACHDPNNAEQYSATDYCDSHPADYFCWTGGPYYCPYHTCNTVLSTTQTDHRALARLWNVKLKIDYVNSAIGSFMSQLSTYSSKYPGRYAVGIDTFGSNTDGAGAAFHVLLPPTTNISNATTAAGTIDVEPALSQAANYGYTYTTTGLTSALSNLTNIGDGSSTSKMKTYVVFLTDAIEDTPTNPIFPWGRSGDLNYANACTALKNAGVSMFSIWAPYYNTGEAQYAAIVAPIEPQAPTTMQGCASFPSQYFEADDGPGITNAVNTTFNTIINNSNLRLTQ